jgi:hypothetical protein
MGKHPDAGPPPLTLEPESEPRLQASAGTERLASAGASAFPVEGTVSFRSDLDRMYGVNPANVHELLKERAYVACLRAADARTLDPDLRSSLRVQALHGDVMAQKALCALLAFTMTFEIEDRAPERVDAALASTLLASRLLAQWDLDRIEVFPGESGWPLRKLETLYERTSDGTRLKQDWMPDSATLAGQLDAMRYLTGRVTVGGRPLKDLPFDAVAREVQALLLIVVASASTRILPGRVTTLHAWMEQVLSVRYARQRLAELERSAGVSLTVNPDNVLQRLARLSKVKTAAIATPFRPAGNTSLLHEARKGNATALQILVDLARLSMLAESEAIDGDFLLEIDRLTDLQHESA